MQFLLLKRVLTLNQEADIFVGCAYTHKRRLDSWVYFKKDVKNAAAVVVVVGV